MAVVSSRGLAADCRRENNLHRGVLSANNGCPPFSPKFGFRILHAATTCGSISGKAFVASFRCGVPTIIGRIQSTAIPRPTLAPLGTKPACVHAVCNQVAEYKFWSENEPPIERQICLRGTVTPFRALSHDVNLAGLMPQAISDSL